VAPNAGAQSSGPQVCICVYAHDALVEALHLLACVLKFCAIKFYTVPDSLLAYKFIHV